MKCDLLVRSLVATEVVNHICPVWSWLRIILPQAGGSQYNGHMSNYKNCLGGVLFGSHQVCQTSQLKYGKVCSPATVGTGTVTLILVINTNIKPVRAILFRLCLNFDFFPTPRLPRSHFSSTPGFSATHDYCFFPTLAQMWLSPILTSSHFWFLINSD